MNSPGCEIFPLESRANHGKLLHLAGLKLNPNISHRGGEDATGFEGKARRRDGNRFEHPVPGEQRSFPLEEHADSPPRCEMFGLSFSDE